MSTLEPVLEGNPLDKHGMNHVIAAIEAEKEQDEASMRQAITGFGGVSGSFGGGASGEW